MKVQSLAVIFAIIILPVIIILSYYIHREVDTIALQTAYDTKLIDATHDAMASFELNTANEDLSSVADALRSIIEASNNTFFNTLATNLGMSNANKSYIQSYIPSILYTLYDGYYIYSPTRVPEVLVGKKPKEGAAVDDLESDQLVYIGDKGVEYVGKNGNIGKYSFNESEFRLSESEDQKNTRQNTLFNNISNKSEFGQILYKNNDGTYSPTLNSQTYYKQDYILKSYMPYSVRYKGSKDSLNYDLTINYTLDNYMSVMGYIGDVYYSKTGYLIGNEVLTEANAQKENYNEAGELVSTEYKEISAYNEIDAEEICLSGQYRLSIKINPYSENGTDRVGSIEYIYEPYLENSSIISSKRLSYVEQKEKLTKLYENIENYYNEYRTTADDATITKDDGTTIDGATRKEDLLNLIYSTNETVQDLELSLENLIAITYYVKAQAFSNWVYNNLGNSGDGLSIKENNISEDSEYVNQANELNKKAYSTDLFGNGNGDLPAFHHDFSGSDKVIFDVNFDPEYKESPFSEHKFDAIKNSIQYNLNLALSSYDEMAKGMDIKMPILSDAEWEKVLSKVSIVSFMQGLNCGLKQYNNYAIVSSTNNELTVIPNEIYYTKKDEYNAGDLSSDECLYHRIDCDKLELEDTDDVISFRSKEVKYDKLYDKDSGRYKYDHKNFACYNCIVNSNFEKDVKDKDGNIVKGYSDDIIISTLSDQKKKIYFRAIGKAKQTIYKTNALTDSSGYETTANYGKNGYLLDLSNWDWILFYNANKGKLKDIKAIELTFTKVYINDPNCSTLEFDVYVNDFKASEVLVISPQETPQTVQIPIHVPLGNPAEDERLQKLTIRKRAAYVDSSINYITSKIIYE